MALSEGAFRAGLDGFSRDDLAAFARDLWAARGWTAERTANGVVVSNPESGAERTLVPVTGGETGEDVAAGVTVVATADELDVPEDVEVVGPGDLYRMARFSVDRESSERLFDAHFDGDADAFAPPAADRDSTGANARGTDPTESATSDSEAGGAASAQTEGDATGGVDDGSAAGDREGDTAGRVTRRAALAGGGAVAGALAVVGVERAGKWLSPRPPGVSRAGVSNPDALAVAHVNALDGESYALTVDRVVRDSGRRLRSSLSMALSLSASRSYESRVATTGPDARAFLGPPPAAATYWSDGEEYLVNLDSADGGFRSFTPSRVAGTWRYWAAVVPFGGTVGSGPRRYYRVLFDAVPTTLAGDRTTDSGRVYDLTGSTASTASTLTVEGARDVRDVTLRASVDERGLVRSLAVEFAATVDGRAVEVARRVDYTGVGATTVTRPTASGN